MPAGRLVTAVVVEIGLAFALVGCGGTSAREPREPDTPEADAGPRLPMAIHEMSLVEVTEGPEAQAILRRLHGEEVAPRASYVGRYAGGGSEAVLYLSRFEAPAVADSLVARMSDAIGLGDAEFAHHASFDVGGGPVHAVLGRGQVHFFYARGPDVTWLSIDRTAARLGLAELLRTKEDRLPTGVVVGGVNVLPPPDRLYHGWSANDERRTNR